MGKRKRKGGTGTKSSSSALRLKRATTFVQDSSESPMYALAFNFTAIVRAKLLASVCKNKATIYNCPENGDLRIIDAFVDSDEQEVFYSCVWLCFFGHNTLLACAGLRGIIKVLNCETMKLHHAFVGHGKAVNSLVGHATKGELLLSGSQDESIRLWNVASKTCVMIFSGAAGHKSEIISLDTHLLREYVFMSSGLDKYVKVWTMEDHKDLIIESYGWKKDPSLFPTAIVQYPLFSTSKVHNNYIDCVSWYGDLIFSKSVDDRIVLWKYETDFHTGDYVADANLTILQELKYSDASIWFMKFSMDFFLSTLAVGNTLGVVHVWSLGTNGTVTLKAKLCTNNVRRPIRYTAVNFDGSVIAGSTEDGRIYIWHLDNDKKTKKLLK